MVNRLLPRLIPVVQIAERRRISMLQTSSIVVLLGGRLAVDFANAPSYPAAPDHELSWEEFVSFLEASGIVSADRGAELMTLPQEDPRKAFAVLSRAVRLRDGLRQAFGALIQKERVSGGWVEPINEVLRITEGHDELVEVDGGWRLEFIAREGGLDWLLAAIARSAAEILVEGATARVRRCANPECELFFCDQSRTGRRRWCSMAICGNRHKVASFARRRL
jgi:predicted RNA-binding Zn ribbon-like protein